MPLEKCSRADCEPTEQIRGGLGAGDYYDVIAAYKGLPVDPAVGDPMTYGDRVERDPANATDVRICCKTCGRATGWQKCDAPGMPGVGRDFSVKRWNESVAS